MNELATRSGSHSGPGVCSVVEGWGMTHLIHGNYVTYVRDKCRCEECREAARVQANDYRRRKAIRDNGNANGAWKWVDAGPVRKHVRWLNSQGIGWMKVAKLAGVSNGQLSNILYGRYDRGDPPAKKVHRDTARKILAVSASQSGHVSADTTWEYIHCLKAYGVTYGRIGVALGQKGPGLQLSKNRVTRRHAETVERLHWGLWGQSGSFRLRCKCPRPAYMIESDGAA